MRPMAILEVAAPLRALPYPRDLSPRLALSRVESTDPISDRNAGVTLPFHTRGPIPETSRFLMR